MKTHQTARSFYYRFSIISAAVLVCACAIFFVVQNIATAHAANDASGNHGPVGSILRGDVVSKSGSRITVADARSEDGAEYVVDTRVAQLQGYGVRSISDIAVGDRVAVQSRDLAPKDGGAIMADKVIVTVAKKDAAAEVHPFIITKPTPPNIEDMEGARNTSNKN